MKRKGMLEKEGEEMMNDDQCTSALVLNLNDFGLISAFGNHV
jgi:hypothetical protein